MPRNPRYHLPGTTYHVMLRGNNGQPIFLSDLDRYRLCFLLQEGVERFGHQILSYCFMSNHIHLAICVEEVSISRIMQNLAFRYAQYFNKKYKHVGHVFQNRFKSIIIGNANYLKELIRYIHLNPVRANLCSHPNDYFWSSHKAYLSLYKYTWVTPILLLKKFGSTKEESQKNYETYVLKGIGIKSQNFINGHAQGILADTEFREDFLQKVAIPKGKEFSLSDLIKMVCCHFQLSEKTLCASGKYRQESHARAVLALFVRDSEHLSIKQLSAILNRDISTLSKLACRLQTKIAQSPKVATEIHLLRNLLNQMP